MRVIEHLVAAQKEGRPLISFEISPPERGGHISRVESIIESLSRFNPPYIDVTSHPARVEYKSDGQGYKKVIIKKRAGTLGIISSIARKYKIDPVPHVYCIGSNKDETEDFLIELSFMEIDNVLAIRGDEYPEGLEKTEREGKVSHAYAIDLVKQIRDMNSGRWLYDDHASATNFCVGVAGYPEKHFQAPNIKSDIARLKDKIDAGADYIVTQMFFDNSKYFDFVKACRAAGIDVPIIPGLKVISRKKHLKTISESFHCDIPFELSDAVENAENDSVEEIGVDWTVNQIKSLFDAGVGSVHLYVFEYGKPIEKVMRNLNL